MISRDIYFTHILHEWKAKQLLATSGKRGFVRWCNWFEGATGKKIYISIPGKRLIYWRDWFKEVTGEKVEKYEKPT